MYYPATFNPHEDGSGRYDVTFADLPGCVSQGKNLEDALLMAQEALTLHVTGMLRAGDPLPAPSSLEQARALEEAEGLEAGDPLPAAAIIQYVLARPRVKEKKPVTVNISLRPAMLEKVDAAAEDQGLTRSGFIVQATQHYMKTLEG